MSILVSIFLHIILPFSFRELMSIWLNGAYNDAKCCIFYYGNERVQNCCIARITLLSFFTWWGSYWRSKVAWVLTMGRLVNLSCFGVSKSSIIERTFRWGVKHEWTSFFSISHKQCHNKVIENFRPSLGFPRLHRLRWLGWMWVLSLGFVFSIKQVPY